MINLLLYLKLCLQRANSHISIPLGLLDKGLLLAVLFKVYGFNGWYVVASVVLISFMFMVFFGHIDIRYGVMEKEVSLHNKYNPEIQELVRRGGK